MQPNDASQTLQRDLKDIVRHAPGRLSIQVVGPAGVVAGWDSDPGLLIFDVTENGFDLSSLTILGVN